MSLWLTDEELETLTGRRRRTAQRAELARQGVKFTTRHDGFPLVPRSQFENLAKPVKRWEPTFGRTG